MELASNVVHVLVMTQLRMWITMYVRAVAERILWSIVVPHLVRMIVSWCNVRILEYVEYRYQGGNLIYFQKDIADFALIVGRIEGS